MAETPSFPVEEDETLWAELGSPQAHVPAGPQGVMPQHDFAGAPLPPRGGIRDTSFTNRPLLTPLSSFRQFSMNAGGPDPQFEAEPPPPRDYMTAPMGAFGLLPATARGNVVPPPPAPPGSGGLSWVPSQAQGGGPTQASRIQRSQFSMAASISGPAPGGCIVVSDPDAFFTQVYEYFHGRGYAAIVIQRAVQLLILAFTVLLTVLAVGFVRWDALLECRDESSCRDLAHYFTASALHSPDLHQRLVFLYATLFGLWWCHDLVAFLLGLRALGKTAAFYRDALRLGPRELPAAEWHEVVFRLAELQRAGRYRFGPAPAPPTAQDVAGRVLRRENYLVALVNCGVLDLSVPLPFLGAVGRGTWAARTEGFYLTRTLEWSIHHCLLHQMFAPGARTLRRAFAEDVGALRRRLRTAGLVHLLLLPFALVFLATHTFLRHAQEWHAEGSYLGPREWSNYARWAFREFNELPHFFERRMAGSYKYANLYLAQFSSPLAQLAARGVRFVSGALLTVLLLLTLIDDSIALHVKAFDHNLLWYMGVLGGAWAAAGAAASPAGRRRRDPEETLRKAAAATHYFPARWAGRAHAPAVRREVARLFPPKAALLATELASLLFAPLILGVSLPRCAQRVVDFIESRTAETEGLGAVCAYGLFEFDKHGDPAYAAPAARGGGARGEGCREGKLEKSFVSFQAMHPDWDAGAAGRSLLGAVARFQQRSLQAQAQAQAQQALLAGSQGPVAPAAAAHWGGHAPPAAGWAPPGPRLGSIREDVAASPAAAAAAAMPPPHPLRPHGGGAPSPPKLRSRGGSAESQVSTDTEGEHHPFAFAQEKQRVAQISPRPRPRKKDPQDHFDEGADLEEGGQLQDQPTLPLLSRNASSEGSDGHDSSADRHLRLPLGRLSVVPEGAPGVLPPTPDAGAAPLPHQSLLLLQSQQATALGSLLASQHLFAPPPGGGAAGSSAAAAAALLRASSHPVALGASLLGPEVDLSLVQGLLLDPHREDGPGGGGAPWGGGGGGGFGFGGVDAPERAARDALLRSSAHWLERYRQEQAAAGGEEEGGGGGGVAPWPPGGTGDPVLPRWDRPPAHGPGGSGGSYQPPAPPLRQPQQQPQQVGPLSCSGPEGMQHESKGAVPALPSDRRRPTTHSGGSAENQLCDAGGSSPQGSAVGKNKAVRSEKEEEEARLLMSSTNENLLDQFCRADV